MFVILEVAIGVVFVYLVLAMLVAATNEVIASTLGWRGRTLEKAVAGLLGEDGRSPGALTEAFYGHPLIRALSGSRRPSYIPAATFATVARDVVSRAAPAGNPDGPPAPSAVAFAVSNTERPGAESLETIFQATMDRTVGWYKRRLQLVTLGVGAAVVVLSNADTIRVANTLWVTPTLRAAVVDAAERRAELPPPTDPAVIEASYVGTDPIPSAEEINAEELAALDERDRSRADEREALGSLIGWEPDYRSVNGAYCVALQADRDAACAGGISDPACRAVLDRIGRDTRCEIDGTRLVGNAVFPGTALIATSLVPLAAGHLFGWFMTLAAITLGAPFWFDFLKGLLNIRGAGKVPDPPTVPGAGQ